ncbi:hypothetical protein [Qipengyuania flava]|uniref:hypothetical protein n=1 Tax=Qipengyuania flava TaxID=192812 RepID=UPI00273DE71C|nr:hypothetical protein [Qipengyuania flava]
MTNIVPLGGELDRLSRKLEHEAQMFLARKGNERLDKARRWIIFDLEFLFDRSRHLGYIQAEGKDAELSIRWPFHQVAAVCWMTLGFIPGETVPVVQGPFVLTSEDADERTMVAALFNALEQDLGAVATTWGGEARDLAVLRRAAATLGLVLPHQLIDGSPYARERLDLCRASCVQASSVHLPELAAAVGVPSKPTPSEDIGKHCEAGNWAKVRDQVLADVLTTAVLTVQHLAAHRQIECHQPNTLVAIADAAGAALPNSEFIRRSFAPWARGKKAESGLRGTVYRAAA